MTFILELKQNKTIAGSVFIDNKLLETYKITLEILNKVTACTDMMLAVKHSTTNRIIFA